MLVYVLECSKGKYYVGRTNNIVSRLDYHSRNLGSEWTKLYKPVRLVSKFNTTDPFDEDKITLKFMSKYGMENVRGGSFSKLVLSDSDKDMIIKMIRNAKDRCFKCGKIGHFIRDCKEELESKCEDNSSKDKNDDVNDVNDEVSKEVNKEVSGDGNNGYFRWLTWWWS